MPANPVSILPTDAARRGSAVSKPASTLVSALADELEAPVEPEQAVPGNIRELRAQRSAILQGGGDERIEKQHAAGKLTSRERIDLLVDRNTFQEIAAFAKHRATYF